MYSVEQNSRDKGYCPYGVTLRDFFEKQRVFFGFVIANGVKQSPSLGLYYCFMILMEPP